VGLTVEEQMGKARYARRTNADESYDSLLNTQAGDRRTAKRAQKTASVFQSTGMTVELPDDLKAVSVRAASINHTDLPTRQAAQVSPDVLEENLKHATQQHSQVTRKASQLLARGAVSTEIAARLYQKMSELEEIGVRPTARSARISRQLGSISGILEL